MALAHSSASRQIHPNGTKDAICRREAMLAQANAWFRKAASDPAARAHDSMVTLPSSIAARHAAACFSTRSLKGRRRSLSGSQPNSRIF